MNWPIGSGKHFKGVYDRETKKVLIFSDTQKGTKEGHIEEISWRKIPRWMRFWKPGQREQLEEEIELLDGASAEFDQDAVDEGCFPRFFWFRAHQFWCGNLFTAFSSYDHDSASRTADCGVIDPMKEDFSAFVFRKIRANMNKAHRDRIALYGNLSP